MIQQPEVITTSKSKTSSPSLIIFSSKFTTFLGTLLAAAFLIGLATTLTRSTMIGFFDVLPVYILMAIAIFMMVYEAFFDKK